MCKLKKCPCCETLGIVAVCPHCDGAGRITTRTLREAQLAHVEQHETCRTCLGHGCLPISLELFTKLGFMTDDGTHLRLMRKSPRSVSA
jgi:hypothetical protein